MGIWKQNFVSQSQCYMVDWTNDLNIYIYIFLITNAQNNMLFIYFHQNIFDNGRLGKVDKCEVPRICIKKFISLSEKPKRTNEQMICTVGQPKIHLTSPISVNFLFFIPLPSINHKIHMWRYVETELLSLNTILISHSHNNGNFFPIKNQFSYLNRTNNNDNNHILAYRLWEILMSM